MLGSWRYSVEEAARGLWRHRWMSLRAVVTTALALLVLGIGLAAGTILDRIKGQLEQRFEIRVFLADEPVNVLQMQEGIRKLPGVTRVTFISRAEALQSLADRLGDKEGFLRSLPRNPLPDSFRVQTKSTEAVESVVKAIREQYPVEEVVYGRSYVEQFRAAVSGARNVVWAVMVLFVGAAIGIIRNTMRIVVAARQNEIEIITLVGGTRAFVRRPFILEGIALGLMAGLLASGALALLHALFTWRLGDLLLLLAPVGGGPMALPIGRLTNILLVVGGLSGGVGAMASVKAYLKQI